MNLLQTETMDVTLLINKVLMVVETHKMDKTGAYARWIWQDESGSRDLGLNEYGCADAANILYTIGEFPQDPKERQEAVNLLQSLQNPETGMFREKTHHEIHTTAHCMAALELYDAKPLYPLAKLSKYKDNKELIHLLEGLDWKSCPWPESHQGAGIYAAMVLSGEVSQAWQDAYFEWLWENEDPQTGFWKKNCVKPNEWGGIFSIFPYLGAAFHYMFNLEYGRRPLRYPDKIIDTCLEIYYTNQWPQLGKKINFAEVDWVYCINRSSRQTSHRFKECKKVLKDFAIEYIQYLMSLNHAVDDGFNDLHSLFGTVCALAELQQALPGLIRTRKPLKLVLDRRPFI